MYSEQPHLHPVHMARQGRSRKTAATYRRTFIRQWREFRGKTLEEVADKIGITHASLSRIERGLQPYSQSILENLATVLSTDVPSLLTRNPTDPDTIWPLWDQAKPGEKQMIVDIAKTIVKAKS